MWKRCGRFWAVLLLCLLVSSLAFSEGLERVYYLTETQLIQLEAIFETLKTENEKLRTSLDESAKEVVALRKDSIQLQDTLKEARNSLTRAEESLKQYAAGMNRTLWTERIKWGAGGIAAGLVATIIWTATR